jgi:serine protease AprX
MTSLLSTRDRQAQTEPGSSSRASWKAWGTFLVAAALVIGSAHDAAARTKRKSQLPAMREAKLDRELARRASVAASWRRTRVIVRVEGKDLPSDLKKFQKARLDLIDSFVLEMPDSALAGLANQTRLKAAHFDRPIWAADYLSTRSTAAPAAWEGLGYTGRGVGVAVIDSGVTSWHDDLTRHLDEGSVRNGAQRVEKFVDFVDGRKSPYDDHGHGTHVAGIILGNGFDSNAKHSGMAPGASLYALKVLDKDGKGTISNIIAALDWVSANASRERIRVVNLSAGAGVSESYWTDPLTVAAKRVVDKGIVVVAAAGNLGKNAEGQKQYGGILSPANAPWVLTVGASSTEGTVRRLDDKVAGFSSRGPTRGDYLAKPDLVAPGYGIVSLASPGSTLYHANPQFLVQGSVSTAYPPYLSLSGTSMAAPQVAGALALMFEANPNLTPNFAKAILQYTAQVYPDYNALEQGAGFLDTLSAVRLARFYDRNKVGARMPVEPSWSRHILWGNHMVSGGYLNPLNNAWSVNVVWGDAVVSGARGDDNIVWGTRDASGDNIVWGTGAGDNIVWGTTSGDNIVWGTTSGDNIVWGTGAGDNIVWGTSFGNDDNIVWGTDCGGDNCTGIVWGTRGDDNIVWGTASPDDNIVWGTRGDDNIVWGTGAGDNIVWGTAGGDNIVWGTASVETVLWGPGGVFDLGRVYRGFLFRWWR